MAAGRILTGTCSWTDPTLIACGRFYPPGVTSAADRLRFYADQFPIVEVDSTYYAPPSERNAHLWAERTPPGFTFNVKAFALLTGHPAKLERLPAPLRDLVPDAARTKRNVYLKDMPSQAVDLLWETHRAALRPLHDAGKLGAVHFQFPPWFRRTSATADYVRRLPLELPDYQVAVEFRGGGWMDEEAAPATLAMLERAGLAYVSVDEPQGFRSSTPPVSAATAELAIVRLHGRNAATWEAHTGAASDRFNYLYSVAELNEWAPRIRRLAGAAPAVHVLFNNNYEDQGVVNARRMAALLADDGHSLSGDVPLLDLVG